MRQPVRSSLRIHARRAAALGAVLLGTVDAAAQPAAAPEDPAALAGWLEQHAGRRGRARAATALRTALAATKAEQPGLPGAALRCALGLVLESLHVARRHLAACDEPSVPQALRERGEQRRAELDGKLRHSELAPFDLSSEEPGWLGALDDAPEAWFPLPHTAWLPDGKYVLHLAPSAAALAAGGGERRALVAEAGKRGAVHVAPPRQRAVKTGPAVIDLGEDAVLEAPNAGPPPPEPHRSLLPGKYQRGLRASAEAQAAAPERGALTVLIGAGSARSARAHGETMRLALAARAVVHPRLAVELGLDGHHAFASSMEPSASGLGAAAGVRALLWPPHQLTLLVAARGRIELREGNELHGGALTQLTARPLRSWPLLLGAEAELEPTWQALSAVLAVELWRR